MTDIHFDVNGVNFDKMLMGIPVVDFMLCVAYAYGELQHHGSARIDFTENDSYISLTTDEDGAVTVAAPQISRASQVDVGELAETIRGFLVDGNRRLVEKFPSFVQSSTYAKIQASASLI
ncbi:hypothetical protein ACIQVL_49430 [Streptomyces sp. NPDC090499]|uniref:hypothetical protein n=1 Tax=Streptomyces sp. NPDC090499 TaxID=3365965 RepID=UPI0038078582